MVWQDYQSDGICMEGEAKMKPISAVWAGMAEYFTSHPGIIINGFSVAEIFDVFISHRTVF